MTPLERTELIEELVTAVHLQVNGTSLSEDEKRWVRNAIKMQEQSYRLRQAVIEKTLSGIVWAGIVWLGSVILGWATQHGYKP